MKKILIGFVVFGACCITSVAQSVYSSNNGKASFSSYAPLEDIYAESNKLTCAINTGTKKVVAILKISTLKMENSLQQEHLNEKYLESHKFPKATFSGIIQEEVDWKKDGVYNVKAVGDLLIHGIGKKRTVDIVITIKDGVISTSAKFKVKVAEHDVDIPKLVMQKVAEEVDVEMSATYELYVPKKKK